MKRGTPESPKVAHLAKLLNIPIPWAVGILEMLWHFTARHAPRGDIGKYPDKAIAAAVDWQRPTGDRGVTPECRLRDALVEAKWLDTHPMYRLIVHDWSDHADQAVRKYLDRHRISFVQSQDSLPLPLPLPLPEPLPLPAPSAPNVTVSPPAPAAHSTGVQEPERATKPGPALLKKSAPEPQTKTEVMRVTERLANILGEEADYGAYSGSPPRQVVEDPTERAAAEARVAEALRRERPDLDDAGIERLLRRAK